VPIVKLFVEGNLESEVLNPILQGSPVLQRGGSKNSLKPRARAERGENRVAAGYLRDRDFDFDPPKTRPDGLNEIDLPPALDPAPVHAWAANNIEHHRRRIAAATDLPVVEASIEGFSARFDDAFVADVPSVLLWFSGKDLLAGMTDWLATKAVAHPGEFRASLRDWIIAHPARTLELLPEWGKMTQILRA
jgi:hypothetical protein